VSLNVKLIILSLSLYEKKTSIIILYMKRYITSFTILVLIAAFAISFRATDGKIGPRLNAVKDNTSRGTFVVYIYLSDKGPNGYQMLSHPQSLVTQRSIDRRLKTKSMNDVVDYTDIPIYQNYSDIITSKVTTVRHQVKWFNAISAEVTKEQIEELSSLNFVKQIELVETFRRSNDEHAVTDQPANQICYTDAIDSLSYGSSLTQMSLIKANLVHNQGVYGQGVMIASFDVGFRNQTHEVFTTLPMTIPNQYDFYTHRPTAGDVQLASSHGTETLSLVGGYKPGQLISPAFKSTYIVARTEVDSFERPLEMDNWVAAAQWADSLGADVITSSLGYLVFDAGYGGYTWQDMNGHTMPVTNGADLAGDRGIVVCNSAGNNGSGANNTLNGPADGDTVFTIGSVTSTGVRSSFSSVGPTTDNPPRIKPDVMAMGSNNRVATVGSNTTYTNGSGTSYSCPMTAGVVAQVLSANKTLTNMQVMGILKKFASNSASPNNLMGWGIIDASLSVDSARKLDNTPPVILHTQPFTSTLSNGIITMKSKITDNGIIRLWTNEAPMLYYRSSTNGGGTWSTYTGVLNSYYNGKDSFFFNIAGFANGTDVQYYFAAQDIALPTPKMSTLPAGGAGVFPPGQTPPPTRFQYHIGPVGITPISSEIPKVFKLYNNYPNPFNPSTKISFDLPKQAISKLVVYDITGREAAVLVNNEELRAGKYEVTFDGTNLASGVYFYRIISGDFADVKKMILIK
jgi:serine protease AprX